MKMQNRIAEYRKEKKLTLRQLGKMVGVCHQAILSYETGKIKKPKYIHLINLAKALETDIKTLFPCDPDCRCECHFTTCQGK